MVHEHVIEVSPSTFMSSSNVRIIARVHTQTRKRFSWEAAARSKVARATHTAVLLQCPPARSRAGGKWEYSIGFALIGYNLRIVCFCPGHLPSVSGMLRDIMVTCRYHIFIY